MFYDVSKEFPQTLGLADNNRPSLPRVKKGTRSREVWISKPDSVESKTLVEQSRLYGQPEQEQSEADTLHRLAKFTCRQYTASDSWLHTTHVSSLLETSDKMADDPRGQFDVYAAEARIEYLLTNQDDQWLDHQETAQELFDYALEKSLELPKYHHARLHKICAPMYSFIGQNIELSPAEINEGIASIRQQLLGYISETILATDDIFERNEEVFSHLRGFANETAILALLLDTRLIQAGLFAVPAFTYQDNHRLSHANFEEDIDMSESPSFDVALYRRGESIPIRKIQVKSNPDRKEMTELYHYKNDIHVVFANKIAHEAAGRPRLNGSMIDLYTLLNEDTPDALKNRMITGLLANIKLESLAYMHSATPLTVAHLQRA